MLKLKNPKSVLIITTILLLGADGAQSIENEPNQSAITMEFVRIPAGSFYIKPAHHIQFTKPFYMGKYEVTQAQWKVVMGTTVSQQRKKANSPWHLKGVGPEHPIYYISYEEATEFCKRLGSNFRLPSESEWEYACRAGSKTRLYYGEDPNYSKFDSYAWHYNNSKGSTHPVGQKKPNKWGLYDMYGNVSEWRTDNDVFDVFDYFKDYTHCDIHWFKKLTRRKSFERRFDNGRSDLTGFRVVFTGDLDNDKKVLEIPLPKGTADPNIAQESKSKIKSPDRMAITGVVRDQEGIPIDGVHIEVLASKYWSLRKYPEGRFETYHLDRSSQPSSEKNQILARHLQRNLVAFVEFNRDINTLDIKLESGAILTGRIVDPHGQGVQDAKITTRLQAFDWNKLLLPTIIKPDVEGKFEIRALPLGHKYKLRATAMGYRLKNIECSSGNTPNNRIDIGPILLDRGQFSVSGVVLDTKRKPVANAAVKCTGENQLNFSSRTDAKGKFTIDGIFEGPVIIWAEKEDSSRYVWYGQKHTRSGSTNVKVVLRQKSTFRRY
ncbi:MAG: SUMF1/EgtB/PvdO family nonheme iron enzyme [Planctomycetes bacterium]|nr:SUMF1/EgtB/PvdO family nonheme iron enzyme [Planctomycetota bacterium]